MMTTGYDIQKYERVLEIAEKLDINVGISGDSFDLTNNNNKCILGKIQKLDEVLSFLCGYDAGFSAGVRRGLTMGSSDGDEHF